LHYWHYSTIQNWQHKKQVSSNWSEYYENNLESNTYLKAKETIIKNWLEKIKPSSVLDLGANTGHFSRLATHHAENVIALESDHEAVEKLVTLNIPNLKTIYADITEPSPGLGFMNKEISPLLERCKADVVMGLALVHHLCITKRLSLENIAYLFATLSNQFVIIEFIPEDDQKVLLLKASSHKNYNPYSEERFIKAFNEYFKELEILQIPHSNRKLFLFNKQ